MGTDPYFAIGLWERRGDLEQSVSRSWAFAQPDLDLTPHPKDTAEGGRNLTAEPVTGQHGQSSRTRSSYPHHACRKPAAASLAVGPAVRAHEPAAVRRCRP